MNIFSTLAMAVALYWLMYCGVEWWRNRRPVEPNEDEDDAGRLP